MSKDIQEAIAWLASFDVHSEYEATNKELILNYIETLEKGNLEKTTTIILHQAKLKNYIPKEVIKEKIKYIVDLGKADQEKFMEDVMFRQGYYKALEDLLENK